MSRSNFEDVKFDALDELIPIYAANKLELDSYTKICDTQKAQIKDTMQGRGETEHTAGGYVAKRIVTYRETMNEPRLIEVLKKHLGNTYLSDIIKTKEYVDMDALENFLYNTEPSTEFATDLASCKTSQEVVQLRISKEKKKKEEQ